MSTLSIFAVIGLLIGFVVTGVSLLVWLAPVSAEEITPAQDTLLNIADGMTKVSLGSLLGFAGGRLAVSRAGDAPS
jgi:hypothetical protein